LIIRNVYFAANQLIGMISEGSGDTEEKSALPLEINYFFKNIFQ